MDLILLMLDLLLNLLQLVHLFLVYVCGREIKLVRDLKTLVACVPEHLIHLLPPFKVVLAHINRFWISQPRLRALSVILLFFFLDLKLLVKRVVTSHHALVHVGISPLISHFDSSLEIIRLYYFVTVLFFLESTTPSSFVIYWRELSASSLIICIGTHQGPLVLVGYKCLRSLLVILSSNI